MQATMREPILNKTSAFTADPQFRHIVGQTHSTFSIREAMDEGYWIIVESRKGPARRTGAHARQPDLHDAEERTFYPHEESRSSPSTATRSRTSSPMAAESKPYLSEARKFGVRGCFGQPVS